MRHFKNKVASAYFSKKQVTIHPCVIHYRKEEEGPVLHKAVTILLDVTSHKAQTIFAFLKSLMAWLRANLPQITQVHYLLDSPSSQYRNASMFRVVHSQQDIFNVRATWNYFESGHSKGPCDGAVKRSADHAIKKGALIKQWNSSSRGATSRNTP